MVSRPFRRTDHLFNRGPIVLPLAVLAPLMYSGGAGSDSRGLRLSRRGSLCKPLSLFRHSTPRVTGSLSPPALTRELSGMGPPQAARVEEAGAGGLLLHCLRSDYKADHICAFLFLLCTQPSVQL